MKDELLIAAAAELDRSGFMPLPGETAEAFLERFRISEEAFSEFENTLQQEGKASVFGECEVSPENRIPPEIVAEAAEKYGLSISGGSDFHGDNRPNTLLGFGAGGLRVPEELFFKLKELKALRSLTE